jgi:tetratricopeptide (TPR) repeat protein/tRNA A-37 threonylcarbamoyl transferase component Bud32
VEGKADTLPLNTTTKRDESKTSSVETGFSDPLLAATQIDPTQDGTGFVPTMNEPTGVEQTLAFVQQEMRRKASAILHTKVGDYEIERELGRGGMGVVYKAHHRQLRRDVALKMILAGKHAAPEQLERFLTEARSVAQLQHPNIVQIFDIGEQDGLPYFSLEFVDGKSLAQVIDKQPQDPDDAARTIEALARTMQYAHDHGVLHRDLKPANVLLNKEGVPKISDFGLAKKIADEESGSTQTGTVMGTPSYMSPEQASGLTHDVGPTADQYSLGAMLYEMLTGRPPFLAAKAVETILQVIHDEPVRPGQLQPGTPVDLETICLKALQKDVGKRYASCGELADDLQRFLNREPILARPVGSLERAWRWCRRNPRVAVPSALAVAVLLIGTVITGWQNVVIKKERDYAKQQESLAEERAFEAKAAQTVAETERKNAAESARIASNQRGLALDTLYQVVTKVDQKLLDRSDMRDLRQELLTDAMNGLKRVEESDDTKSLIDRSLGVAHQRMADIFQQAGDTEKAVEQHQQALGIFEKLIKINPEDDWAKWDAAISCDKLGSIAQASQGDVVKARDYFLKALRWREELHSGLHIRDPELTPAKVETSLVNSYAKTGMMAMAAGDAAQARDYFLKTLARSERLANDNPKNTVAQQALAGSYFLLARLSFHLRDTVAAEKYCNLALNIRERLLSDSSQSVKANLDLSRSLHQRAQLQLQLLLKPDLAVPDYERARQICQSLYDKDSKDADVRRELAVSLHNLGTAQLLLDQQTVAEQNFREALALRQALSAEDPQNLSKKLEVVQSQARAGDHEEAFQLGQSLLLQVGEDNRSLFNLVCGFAICVAAAQRDVEEASSETQKSTAAGYADAAIEVLRLAVKHHYNDLTALETDPDLSAIRGDPRFSEIVAGVRSAKEAGGKEVRR